MLSTIFQHRLVVDQTFAVRRVPPYPLHGAVSVLLGFHFVYGTARTTKIGSIWISGSVGNCRLCRPVLPRRVWPRAASIGVGGGGGGGVPLNPAPPEEPRPQWSCVSNRVRTEAGILTSHWTKLNISGPVSSSRVSSSRADTPQ